MYQWKKLSSKLYAIDKITLFIDQICFPGSLGTLVRFCDLAPSQTSSVCSNKFPTDTFQKTHDPENISGTLLGRRRRDQQRMRWLGDITNSMDISLSKCQKRGKPGMPQSIGFQRVGLDWATEQLGWKYRQNTERNFPLSSDILSSPGLSVYWFRACLSLPLCFIPFP